MLLTAHTPAVGTYRVEVSGWDSSQAFFVEKTELEWSEESGKMITLKRELRPDTMIFVRLLQSTVTDRGFPVAYKAEHVANLPGGQQQFRLQQVVPRINPN
jgi:hypothetical protein